MNRLKLRVSMLVFIVCIIFSSNVYAIENIKDYEDKLYISKESEDFLETHNINVDELKLMLHQNNYVLKSTVNSTSNNNYVGVFDEDIKALKNADKVYNFDDVQIRKYVDGLLNTKSEVDISHMLRSIDRPSNDDGVGYEVQSKAGYMQATSYASLPNRSINNLTDIAYLFYSIAPNTYDSPVFDFGVRGGIYHWAGQLSPNPNGYEDNSINRNDGDKIYFNINVDKNNWVRCRAVSASDFSNVLYDKYYYLNGITKHNASFNKQITLCNPNRDFNTGSAIYNGGFSQSYLYRADGSYAGSVTNRTGKFGVSGINGSRDKVVVNSSTQWDTEDVTIRFY